MSLTVLNNNFERVYPLDILDSMIWTERYSKHGEFEIQVKANLTYLAQLKEGYFLSKDGTDRLMVIESLNLKTDVEDGNKFIVKGRSFETIIERRIVWKQTLLSGGLQASIKKLLMDNAISPEDPDRKISKLMFEESDDPLITSLSIDDQFHGETLYEVVEKLCTANGIGFKITLSPEKNFIFKLYAGVDRSYSQSSVPIVAFSPKLDNLSNSSYYHTSITHRTITLVLGEGEGSDRPGVQISLGGDNTELNRRELFTDASDLSATTEDGVLDLDQYNTLLAQRGVRSLLENQQISAFDGTVIATVNYTYGTDFFIGDIVQIENEYGLTGTSRVTEIVFSEDPSGVNTFPTFESIT